jgi:hypothetical protein
MDAKLAIKVIQQIHRKVADAGCGAPSHTAKVLFPGSKKSLISGIFSVLRWFFAR